MSVAVTPAKPPLALPTIQFFITGTTGFIQPFLPLYLVAAGLTAGQYGIASAIGTATCLVIQPALGVLSDRIDARRPVMLGASLVAGAAYFGFRYAPSGDFWAFVALLALGANGFQYLNAATGVLVARAAQSTGEPVGGAYVRTRVWGSVGYIVIALTAGLLVRGGDLTAHPPRAVLQTLFTWMPALFLVIAGVCYAVPDTASLPARVPSLPPAPSLIPMREGAGGREGHSTANRRRFLLAFLLYQIALAGASGYLSLFLAALHAAPIYLTLAFAAGVSCEVLVMTRIGKWSDKYGRRPAMLLSFLLLPVRLLLYIPATTPLYVVAVQSLHGFNFGILGTIAVVFVNDTATDANRGAAQAELAAALGLGTAIGVIVCGYLVEHHGIGAMYAAMSGLALVAAVLFCATVAESHTGAEPLFAEKLPRILREPWFGERHAVE